MNRISVFVRRQRIKKLEIWATRAILAEAFFLAIFPSVAMAAVVVGTALWFMRLQMDSRFKLRTLPLDVPVTIFVLLSTISVFKSPVRDSALIYNYLSLLGIFGLTYVLVGQNIRTPEQVKQIVKALALATLIVVLGGYFQYVFGIDVAEMKWIDGEAFPEMRKRIFSTMANPNVLAGFLNVMICLALGLLVKVADGRVKFLAVVAIFMAAACLAMTYSRAAFLSMAIIFVILGILHGWRALLISLAAMGILIYTHEAFLEQILSIFTTTSDSIETLRTGIWVGTISMIADHPFAGIGWGAFEAMYPQYDYYSTAAPIPIRHAQNLYLNMAAEVGIVGALAYFWYFFGTMLRALTEVRREDIKIAAVPSKFTRKLVEIFISSRFLQTLAQIKSMTLTRLADISNQILDRISFTPTEKEIRKSGKTDSDITDEDIGAAKKNPELVHHEEMKWSSKKNSDDDDKIDIQKFAAEFDDDEMDLQEWKQLRDAQIIAGVKLGIGLAFLSMALNGMSDDLLFDVPSSILMWMLGALGAAINLLDEE